MKSKKTIVMLSALAALCLTSCDKNEEVNANDGAVRFTAGIGQEAVATPQSRAAGTIWAAGDKIGIFKMDHGTISPESSNKEYTTANGNGVFTPIAGDEIYYKVNGTASDFIAYYPYKADANFATALSVEIGTTQTDDTQADFDLMWAKADNAGKGYTKKDVAPVEFTFAHCLSKLTMNCKVDANVGAQLTDAKVTIHGMNTRHSFDLATGTFSGTPGTVADISPRKLATAASGFDGTYDAIILPGSYADDALTVGFTLNGETYTWKVKPITFDAGSEYIYDVTITRTGVTASGTIENWVKVPKGPVTAE